MGGLAGWRVGMRQGIPFRQGMRVGGLESWDRGSAAALFSLDGADPISADPIWPILPENSRLYFWRPARQVLPCSPSPPLPLQKQLAEGAGGSMYVSGLPGTGALAVMGLCAPRYGLFLGSWFFVGFFWSCCWQRPAFSTAQLFQQRPEP